MINQYVNTAIREPITRKKMIHTVLSDREEPPLNNSAINGLKPRKIRINKNQSLLISHTPHYSYRALHVKVNKTLTLF